MADMRDCDRTACTGGSGDTVFDSSFTAWLVSRSLPLPLGRPLGRAGALAEASAAGASTECDRDGCEASAAMASSSAGATEKGEKLSARLVSA